MLYDNILVPYDGSSSSQAALAEAVRYAKDDPGLTLHIIQIVDADRLAIDKLEDENRDKASLSSDELRQAFDKAVEEADARLHRQINGILKGLMNKVYVELLKETRPGEQIVTYAVEHKCDLIIMGSRGLGVLRGILGSVSSHVLREAEVPVLVVKE